MKKILNSAWIFLALFAFAQVSNAQNLKTGDLVTISDGTNYLRNNNGSIANTTSLSTTNIESCLWKIAQITTTTITLRSYSDSTKYLYMDGNKQSATLSLGTTGTAFSGTMNNGNSTRGSITTSLTKSFKKTTYYVRYSARSSGWNASTTSTTLTLQKWTKTYTPTGGTLTPNITTTGETSWKYYKEPDGGDNHTCTIRFNPTLDKRVSVTYTNASNNTQTYTITSTGETITDPATLHGAPYNLNVTWNFKKANAKTSTMSATEYTNAVNQTMMTAGNGACYSGSNWVPFTVTPNGNSPMNIRDKSTDKMCDYEDVLVVTFTYKDGSTTKTVEEEIPFTRKTFRQETIGGLTLDVNPDFYQFKATSNLTKAVTVEAKYEEGSRLIWLNGETEEEYASDITVSEDLDLFGGTPGVTCTSNVSASWLTWTPNAATKTFTLTADRNTTDDERSATGTITVNYNHGGQNYTEVADVNYSQAGVSGSGVVRFEHQRGVSNSPLDSHGYQQVHEHETTIYYYPGENIYLQIKEQSFFGYARWYDYDTDKNPERNTNPSDQTTWNRLPQANGNFVELNPDDDTYNAGFVATYTTTPYNKLAGRTSPNNPILVGWADGKAHKMAVDVSMYTDYTISSTRFVEPTLSYRQIFNLRPATEIADAIAECTGTVAGYATDKYYEDYQYLAPAGTVIYLTPQFRYRNVGLNTHESDKCYYFYDTKDGNKLKNIGGKYNLKSGSSWNYTVTWYKDGVKYTPEYGIDDHDYVKVYADDAERGVVTYTMRIDELDLNIARFVVDFRDRAECGPSTTTIISKEKIDANFIPLAENNFDYGAPAPGTTDIVYSGKHMPWTDASYGYFYPTDVLSHGAASDANFAVYGEYTLVNRVNQSWIKGENHGGAANGYCMYVDGALNPGVVARISTDASICAGQDIYCSAWVCYNPGTYGGTQPIFRFNVQGRNSNSEPWTDVAVFMAGTIAKSANWQQVVFPVTAKHDYNQVRVSVYNFAPNTNGNDFLIDDISLFASKLPLSAYQANTACTTNERITAIIRMDYMSISDDWTNPYWYYDIYNETSGEEVEIPNFYHADTSEPASDKHGSIAVYAKSYVPPVDCQYSSIAAFIDTVHARAERSVTVPVEGFVQETVLGEPHWIAYFVHDVKDKFVSDNIYTVRMAAAVADLPQAMCALRTPLPISDRTALSLDGENIVSPVTNICANGLFRSVVEITNVLPEHPDTKLTAECMADWLWGYQSDSIYHEKTATPEQKVQADADFVTHYHYSRTDVRSALADLRRAGDEQHPNPNRFVKDFDDIQRTAFNNEEYYNLIADLYHRELLILGKPEMNFFLGSDNQVRFWIYPVEGSAIATYVDEHGVTQEVELQLCNNPQWLDLQTKLSSYQLNMGTRDYDSLTAAEKLEVPGVRIAACLAKDAIKVPLANISTNVVIGRDSTMVIATDDKAVQDKIDRYGLDDPLHFSMRYYQDRLYSEVGDAGYYKKGENIVYSVVDAAHVAEMKAIQQAQGLPDGQPGFWYANTDEMKPGYTYRIKTTMMTKAGSSIGDDPSCPVGEAFFNLIIVPDTMIWRPSGTHANEWGDDRNWHAWVNGEEWDHGWAPLPQTHVVIPELEDEALYPYVSGKPFSYDANYVTDMCRKIYFAPGAMFENQNDLKYENAVVDVAIPTEDWYGVAAPLQNVYSGDFYSPREENKDWFVAKALESRNDKLGFRYYGAYYNTTVQNLHHDVGWKTRDAQADWVASNSVDKELLPGHGMGIAAFGPTGGSAEQAVVRMPKQETSYVMYDSEGKPIDGTSSGGVDRSNAFKFAFQLDADKDYQTVTLNNELSETRFLFGNPTMAYIDMYKFAMDNDLQPYIYYMDQSNWKGVELTASSAERFLAPTRAVLVVAKQEGKEVELHLKLSHLTSNKTAQARSKERMAPMKAPAMEEERYGLMKIEAFNEDAMGVTSLSYNNYASNKYDVNEDALFISSGVLNENVAGVVTPFNIYTVANDTALALNVRNTFAQIPVAFLILDDYVSDSLTLAFTLSQTWNEEMYFCDSKDGSRVRIYDATMVRIETPNNYEQRYYLQGTAQNDEEQHTTTVIEEIKTDKVDNDGPTGLGIAKWIQNGILVIRRDGKLYNAQGQILRVLK